MNYWLIKSEASCYSIEDLKRDKKAPWTGIRNYQARNFMSNGMKEGDLALFYHSSSEPTGAYGIAKVASEPHADQTQFDKKDEHYDPKATKEKPIWQCVDVEFLEKFKRPVSLSEIKIDPKLSGILVAKRGMRLSVMPVTKEHFEYIRDIAN